MTTRGHQTARPSPGRFRCLVCKLYVTGTASGHCPRCGFVPPSALEVPTAARRSVLPAIVMITAAAALAWLIS